MTGPVTYTREQMLEAAELLEYQGDRMLAPAAAMLRQAAAEGQGNERLQAQVAELEGWNDAAL